MNDIVGDVSTGPGFAAFLDPSRYVEYSLILIAATLSGAILAYHPVYRGRPRTLETIELSKTLMIYSVGGALISIICTVNPSMAFVIFGIGGLMRFRTQLGAGKSTGHAIIGTLIGLSWGLGLEMVAAIATVYFWGMIFLLERTMVVEVSVGGVELDAMPAATDAYRKAIANAGCRMLSDSKNFKKREMRFFFSVPRKVSMNKVIGAIDKISPELRGTPDLPE